LVFAFVYFAVFWHLVFAFVYFWYLIAVF